MKRAWNLLVAAALSRIGALLLAVGLVVAMVAGAEAEPRRIVREGAFGCRSLDYLGQMVRAMRQGDGFEDYEQGRQVGSWPLDKNAN